mgnify:FL=1
MIFVVDLLSETAMNSLHADKRAQQRGVPPLIRDWLLAYGEEDYDGHGGIRRYFSPRSIRMMQRSFGREPLRQLDKYLNSYLIESSRDGAVITIGHRLGSMRSKH